jgi:iron complex transport system substrate-binding protein
MRRIIQTGLLSFLAIVIVACNGVVSSPQAPSKTHSIASSSATRTVTHALGTVEVPTNPQRIVAISPCILEATLSLDVQPVGGSHWNWQQPDLQGVIDSIKDVGWIPHPSLESILALKPDLILGATYQAADYEQLSRIAPTVLVDEASSGAWKEVFKQMAEALGESETAKQVLNQYYERLATLQQQLNGKAEDLQISVAALYQGQINLYYNDHFAGTILKDAGLSRPPSQNRNSQDVLTDSNILSRERLQDLDADVLFLVNNSNHATNQEKLQQLNNDPLWKRLNVVQQEKVFVVPDYWISCSPIAANAVIDDLFQYLVTQP